MKRRSRRPTVLGIIGVFLFVGVIGLLMLANAIRTNAAPTHVIDQSSPHVPSLDAGRADATWYGKPVYFVTNNSDVSLPHVVLQSWSGDDLPVLVEETRATHTAPTLPNIPLSGPIDLPPHTTLWFVGAKERPTEIVVNWLSQGKLAYEVLHIGE